MKLIEITMKNFLILLIILMPCFYANATTWFVNINATGLNNGSSWTNAYNDLQNGIASSAFGDTIWVAMGTYKPTYSNTRITSFTFKNGTKAFGGFNGTETTFNQRNYNNNITILSGEIGSGSSNDNSFSVVDLYNVTNQTKIDGFEIKGGYGSAPGGVGSNSGLGGGIYSDNSSAIIQNCKIVGNYAQVDGGGIYHEGSGSLTINNCVFNGNTSASTGAAITIKTGTNNQISNCYFVNNQAAISGSVLTISPMLSDEAQVTINNSVIAGNTSNTGAIYLNRKGTLILNNSLIVGNYSNQEALIRTETSLSTKVNRITNCTVAHNKQADETSSSRAIQLNANSIIENSIIYGNSSASQILAGPTVNNSIVQQGTNTLSGTNIITSNPQFVSPGVTTNAPFDTSGLNYNLNLFSQGIDFGINSSVAGTLDLEGNPRIQNTNVDLGAYESNFCTSTIQLTPAAPYMICGGNPLVLKLEDGVNFAWSTGSSIDSISVTSAGVYSVVFEDINGCRGSAQATVTASPLPTPTISLQGGILSTANFSSYQWSFNNAELVGEINQTYVPLNGYGIYSIEVENSSGCVGTANYCFSPVTLTASGPTTFCQGELVTLSVNNSTNQVWSTNSLNSTITIANSGTYSVTAFNAGANCSVNLQQQVVVNSLPSPTIIFSGNQIQTQVFSTYQWYLNGIIIPGANAQTYTLNENGQYTVEVTNNSGCSSTSAVYNINNLGLENKVINAMNIYPNPTKSGEILYFSLQENLSGKTRVKIVNQIGKIVYIAQLDKFPSQIQLPQLARGMYYIELFIDDQLENGTRVKLIIE